MDTLVFAFNAVMPVVLLAALGYALKRAGIATPEFTRVCSKLCYYVFLPVLLFFNIYKTSSLSDIRYDVVGFAVAGIFALYLLGLFAVRFVRDRAQKGVVLQCVVRSNFAMYGLPLAVSLSGDAGAQTAAALSVFSIPLFNILAIVALTRFSGDEVQRPSAAKLAKDIMTNPLILGVAGGFLALCLRLLFENLGVNFRLDTDAAFLYKAVEQLANVASPLSLVVLGAQFEFSSAGALKKQITLGTLMRLVVAPVLVLGAALALLKNTSAADFAGLIALFGSPAAVSSAILARELNSDYELASQLVVWTTVFSFLSVFLLALVFRAVGVL